MTDENWTNDIQEMFKFEQSFSKWEKDKNLENKKTHWFPEKNQTTVENG